MALTSNTAPSSYLKFEKECRQIHTVWNRPGQLGRALAHRTPTERQQIKENYLAIYGKDLVERLQNDLEVPTCAALYMWMLDQNEHDAMVARDAIARSEPDYKALVEIYARRKSSQLFFTKQAYLAIYGKDLVERLQNDLEVPTCAALYMWMLDQNERDAMVARDAIARSEPDYKALVEIYARRKSSQLFFTKQAYLTKFKTHLDQDIISDSSHPYQRILGALATSHRSHHEEVSRHIAKCDAMKLHGATKLSSGGVDEATILEIFSKRSIPQLRLAFFSYKQIYGHDFTAILKRESGGEFGESLGIVIQCMCDPFEYYSQMVLASLKGGEAKRVLTRVMMGSAEVGMEKVSTVFQKRHGMKIQDAIRENVADEDYGEFLLALTNATSSN